MIRTPKGKQAPPSLFPFFFFPCTLFPTGKSQCRVKQQKYHPIPFLSIAAVLLILERFFFKDQMGGKAIFWLSHPNCLSAKRQAGLSTAAHLCAAVDWLGCLCYLFV